MSKTIGDCMSFLKDLVELFIITSADELKKEASPLARAMITTVEVVGDDFVSKINEKLEDRNIVWLDNNMYLFPKNSRKYLQEMIEKLTNEQFMQVSNISFKKPITMFFVSLFLGLFGVDRFLLGDIKMGIIKLMTFGGLLVMWAIDLFTINKRTKIYNLNMVNSIFNKGVMNEKHE